MLPGSLPAVAGGVQPGGGGVIRLQSPYDVQAQDTADSTADIVNGYGVAAHQAMTEAIELQQAAFRMGATLQLQAAAADLRNWAVAYSAKARAIMDGAETSDDAKTDAARWATVAAEIRSFAKDWLIDASKAEAGDS